MKVFSFSFYKVHYYSYNYFLIVHTTHKPCTNCVAISIKVISQCQRAYRIKITHIACTQKRQRVSPGMQQKQHSWARKKLNWYIKTLETCARYLVQQYHFRVARHHIYIVKMWPGGIAHANMNKLKASTHLVIIIHFFACRRKSTSLRIWIS